MIFHTCENDPNSEIIIRKMIFVFWKTDSPHSIQSTARKCREESCRKYCRNIRSVWGVRGGGMKLDNLLDKKSPNQLCWLTTHARGLIKMASRFCSIVPHQSRVGGGSECQFISKKNPKSTLLATTSSIENNKMGGGVILQTCLLEKVRVALIGMKPSMNRPSSKLNTNVNKWIACQTAKRGVMTCEISE